LMVFNKLDLYRSQNFDELLLDEDRLEIEENIREHLENNYGSTSLLVSAVTKENIDKFREVLGAMILAQYNIRYPYVVKRW